MKAVLFVAALFTVGSPVFAGGPTVAADEPMPAVAPASAMDWSGPYAGLSYGRYSGDFDALIGGALLETYAYEPATAPGAIVGYNFQRGKLVYGAELAYSKLSMLIPADGDDTLDSLIDLRGRLGYAVGKSLFYGAVSYSSGDMTINATDSATVTGVGFGIGVDFKIRPNMFVGLDYSSRKLSGTNGPATPFDVETTVKSVGIRVGLSF